MGFQFRVAAGNAAAERIFGYSREEAMGPDAHFIVAPAFRERVDRVWQNFLEQKGATRSAANDDNMTKDAGTISCEWYKHAAGRRIRTRVRRGLAGSGCDRARGA